MLFPSPNWLFSPKIPRLSTYQSTLATRNPLKTNSTSHDAVSKKKLQKALLLINAFWEKHKATPPLLLEQGFVKWKLSHPTKENVDLNEFLQNMSSLSGRARLRRTGKQLYTTIRTKRSVKGHMKKQRKKVDKI